MTELNTPNLINDRMGSVPIGQPMDPSDHPADSGHQSAMGMNPGKAHFPLKSNIPDPDPHTDDPWNKPFGPDGN